MDVAANRSHVEEIMDSIHKAADKMREMEANKSNEQDINRYKIYF